MPPATQAPGVLQSEGVLVDAGWQGVVGRMRHRNSR